jgi:hypothetical protein
MVTDEQQFCHVNFVHKKYWFYIIMSGWDWFALFVVLMIAIICWGIWDDSGKENNVALTFAIIFSVATLVVAGRMV